MSAPPTPPTHPLAGGPGPSGAIYDTGYRHYEGTRLGVGSAIRSVAVQGVQRVLGIRRPMRTKIVPTLTVFITFVPAIVYVGFAVIAPEDFRQEIITSDTSLYASYYGSIVIALVLFTAFSGPEVLCPDRRTGMLGMYLASPLDRDRYLLAKAIGVASVLGIVTIGPPLLLLAGYTTVGLGPDGPLDFGLMLVRILAAGLAVTALYTSLSMAVSSVTARNAAATAAIVVILLTSVILAASLVESAGADESVALLNLFELPIEVVYRIYGENSAENDSVLYQLPTAGVLAAYFGWTAAFATFVRYRYQRLDVTR
jgi:ABC-2 type transport system permease protein